MTSAATRAPPTPSTARKAPCAATDATGPSTASSRARRRPARKASRDDASTTAASRSSARAARIVRTPDSARSTPAVIAPTAVCAASEALRSRRTTSEARVEADHDREHGDAEQHPVDERHGHEGAARHDDAGDEVDEPGRHDRPQQRGVGADPRDQVAGAPAVELGDGQAQQPPHEGRPRLEHERLTGALQDVALHARDRGGDEQGDGQHDGEPGDRLVVLDGRDDPAGEQGLRERGSRAGEGEHHREQQRRPVRAQQPPERAEVRTGGVGLAVGRCCHGADHAATAAGRRPVRGGPTRTTARPPGRSRAPR